MLKNVKYPSFIVTGCARSGTAFMANLLTQGGIICNHEVIYGMPGYGTWREGATAEASWLAVPFLCREKAEGRKIIHIIRHPLKQISSLMHVNFFEDHNFRGNLYTMYTELDLPDIRRLSLKDMYIAYWIKWNLIIEEKADLIYRLEDLVKHPQELFKDLGIKVKKKLDTKKVNAHKNPKQYDWKDFVDCRYYKELLDMAHRYEYITNKELTKLKKLAA